MSISYGYGLPMDNYPAGVIAHPAISDLNPRLAAELAANLEPREEVLARYDIDENRWEELRVNPVFRSMLREALANWQSADNTEKRVKVKSGIAVEETIATLHAMIRDPDTPPSSRVESFKVLMRLGKLDVPEAQGVGPVNGFSITINLGENHRERIVTGTVLDHAS